MVRQLADHLADHPQLLLLARHTGKLALPQIGRVQLDDPVRVRIRCRSLHRLDEPVPVIVEEIAAEEERRIPQDVREYHGGALGGIEFEFIANFGRGYVDGSGLIAGLNLPHTAIAAAEFLVEGLLVLRRP